MPVRERGRWEAGVPDVEFEGRRVHYEDEGAGPLVVLLPPGASPATIWNGVIERLAIAHRCVAIDLSGYGGTDRWRGARPLTLDDDAALVRDVIGRIGGPVHLVGHSYGGSVALRLVLATPGEARSLLLLEPACYPLLQASGEAALFEELRAVNDAYIATVRAGDRERACRAYVDYYSGQPGLWERMSDAARERLIAIADVVAGSLAAAMADPTTLDDYRGLVIAVSLACGAATDPAHGRITRILADVIPAARLEVVAGAGHMSSLTHPDAIARLIAGRVEASAAGGGAGA